MLQSCNWVQPRNRGAVIVSFPIEFSVQGTPVSVQAKKTRSKVEWKERVAEACRPQLPTPHFVSDRRVAATLFYFPDGPMQGDVDNIVKLTLDALKQVVYIDDLQVERVVVQKFEPGRLFSFTKPSVALAAAIEANPPTLYIRISDDPHEDLE